MIIRNKIILLYFILISIYQKYFYKNDKMASSMNIIKTNDIMEDIIEDICEENYIFQ
jgi:hypothetical protein